MARLLAVLLVLLPVCATAQEAEREQPPQPLEQPVEAAQYDSQGYGWMQLWEDGDGDPLTVGVTAYGLMYAGIEVLGYARVRVDSGEIVEIYGEGVWHPVPIEAVYGPVKTFDGADCRSRDQIAKAMGVRFWSNLKGAFATGAFTWFVAGPPAGIIAYTGHFTIRFMWDAAELNYRCWGEGR